MTGPTAGDPGGQMITIGLRDLYVQQQEMSREVIRLSTKIDGAVTSQTFAVTSTQQTLSAHAAEIGDHEIRLRAMEARPVVTPRAVWAAAALIISVLGLFITVLQLVKP